MVELKWIVILIIVIAAIVIYITLSGVISGWVNILLMLVPSWAKSTTGSMVKATMG